MGQPFDRILQDIFPRQEDDTEMLFIVDIEGRPLNQENFLLD